MSDTTTKRIPKRGGPSNAVLVVAILVALVGMGVVNTFTQNLDPKEIEKREQEQMEAEAKKQQEAQAKAQASNATAAISPAGQLATFGEEKILGKPEGKPEVTIAWQWTPEVQANPEKVSNSIDVAVKVLTRARIRVLNVDANPDMEPGIYVDGVKKFAPQPDGSFPPAAELYSRLANMPMLPPP
jgi:hypothetical protein